MRKMRFYLVHTPMLICLLISLAAQAQIKKIYLNPKAAGNSRQSQFVDSIRFIPLEIKNEVEIGAYSNVQVTDNYFMVTDYLNMVVLLYSRNGRFAREINFKKLGQGFYPSYNEHTRQLVFFGNNKNYTLTGKDRLKITLDWNNPRNKKYFKKYRVDLEDTTLTMQKDVPNEKDIIHSYPFYDDYYWQGQITTSALYKDSLDYELKIYKDRQVAKAFFPYNHINETRFLFTDERPEITSAITTDNPYIHIVTRPYCDTIYKMIKDSLFPAYQLVLPIENSLPPSFFNRPFKNKTERDNYFRNNGWMLHQVYNVYETPMYIQFIVSYLSNNESYIYQKQTNVTYKAKNIKPDSSQYNLQLLGDFYIAQKGDHFYKMIKADDLLGFFQKSSTSRVPKELESFLKSNPPKNSPVIVEFKLKSHL